MKQFIRNKTFETNSSSTHSLTLDNHNKITDLLYEAINKIESIDSMDEVYAILGLMKRAERLLLDNLGDY